MLFFLPTEGASYHPHILEMEDWEWLKQRPEYFARKFDIDSSLLLDMIDNTLLI